MQEFSGVTRGVAKAAGVAIVCDTCSHFGCRLSSAMFVSDGTQLTPLTPRITDCSIDVHCVPASGFKQRDNIEACVETFQEYYMW